MVTAVHAITHPHHQHQDQRGETRQAENSRKRQTYGSLRANSQPNAAVVGVMHLHQRTSSFACRALVLSLALVCACLRHLLQQRQQEKKGMGKKERKQKQQSALWERERMVNQSPNPFVLRIVLCCAVSLLASIKFKRSTREARQLSSHSPYP